MEIQIAIAKTNKAGSKVSGDTLEVIERPRGGYSVVLCDGQTTGPEAKAMSSLAVRKVITLIAEGVRDSAASRAASDHLYSIYNGNISAYLDILSADLQTNTLVVSRNNPTALFIIRENGATETLSGFSTPIGNHAGINPEVVEIPLAPGLTAVMSTDGFLEAGKQFRESVNISLLMESLLDYQQPDAQFIADQLIKQAIRADDNTPHDDMSVVVLRVQPKEKDHIRRLNVTLPIETNTATATELNY
jgi:serine phosphatase RsbU (regulator of sigma subunit)